MNRYCIEQSHAALRSAQPPCVPAILPSVTTIIINNANTDGQRRHLEYETQWYQQDDV